MNQIIEAETETGIIASPTESADMNPIVNVISRAMTDPSLDANKMEQILAMQERILDRQAKQRFHAAMARAQAEMPKINKRGAIVVKGVTRSKYARYEDIMAVVKPVLQKYDLYFSAKSVTPKVNGMVDVEGTINHVDGYGETSYWSLPAESSGSKNNVQGMGSSLAYARRYCVCCLLDIVTEDQDNDGNNHLAPKNVQLIDAQQVAQINGLISMTGSNIDKFCQHLQIPSVEAMPVSSYQTAITVLEKKATVQNANTQG